MGSLDIKDAFRQVDQKKELQVTMHLGRFRASKNLPGQRQEAQAWSNHLVELLESIGPLDLNSAKRTRVFGERQRERMSWEKGRSSLCADSGRRDLSEPYEVTRR